MNKSSLFHGPKFAISEFSRPIEYDFLKDFFLGDELVTNKLLLSFVTDGYMYKLESIAFIYG